MVKLTYRKEIANRIERGRAVGNLYGVGRYVDGRRNAWVLQPQRSETFRDAVYAGLVDGTIVDDEGVALFQVRS